MFQVLFTTNIDDSIRFKSFSVQHAALILIAALAVALVAITVWRSGEEQRRRALLCFTWALPAMYAFRVAVFALLEAYVEPQISLMDRLPLQLCYMNAIVMPIGVLSRNRTLLNYMYAVCLPGAAAAMLTPAMSYYGRYAFFSWQVVFFFLDHSIMALVPILAIIAGYFRPNIRRMPAVLAILSLYALCMYPLNKLLDQNYLFLNYPDKGTVMAFFARYLGNPGYLLPLAALAVILVSLMLLPWKFIPESAKDCR